MVLGSTLRVPTTAEGYAALQNAGLGRAGGRRVRARGGARPGRGGRTRSRAVHRPSGNTLSGIAAGAGVSVRILAAMNGLDPAGILPAGTVIKLPSGAPAPARAAEPAPGAVVANADPAPTRDAGGRGRHPVRRVAVRRLALARRRDRMAGERVQQRDGVGGQRARRDAGDAGHVGLRPAEPLERQLTCAPRPTTCTPAYVPQAAARPDRRRREQGDRGLLPGHRLGAETGACTTTRSGTSRTCRRCAPASAAEADLRRDRT